MFHQNVTVIRFFSDSATLLWLLFAAWAGLATAPQARAEEAVLATLTATRHIDAVPRHQCFPLEDLPEELRGYSAELLLKALDSEALYTFVGPIKPVSEGFYSTRFRIDPPDSMELEKVRKAISVWRCGSAYQGGVLVYNQIREGERYASAWFANRKGVENLVVKHEPFFARLGLHADSQCETILTAIESTDQPAERWRGLGLLFGYPEPAIDFFVRAGEHYAETGEFIERDFRNFPTFARETGKFVYAVPRLSPETEKEQQIRRQVNAILSLYQKNREKYVQQDNSQQNLANSVTQLIRDWFDDGTGFCHPEHALQKAHQQAEIAFMSLDASQAEEASK